MVTPIEQQSTESWVAVEVRRRLVERQKTLRVSSNTVARSAGFARQTWYRYLKGERGLSLDRLMRAAIALDFEPAELLPTLEEMRGRV